MLGRWKNRSVLSPALDDSSMDVLVNLQVYKKHALSPNPYFYLYIILLFSIIIDINFKYVVLLSAILCGRALLSL